MKPKRRPCISAAVCTILSRIVQESVQCFDVGSGQFVVEEFVIGLPF
jgi:hypothetical protein